MALPTVFTSGDVFTAANANLLRSNQYNKTTSTKTVSYVLVAADVGTRVLMNAAGSTTITVNTSLFAAGDTLEISNIGAGVCTITSGTCTVTSSSNLALAQYVSGTLFFTSASAAIFIASAVTSAVLQVKSTALLSTFTTTSATFTGLTGLTVSITPSSASNKVLVIAQISYALAAASTGYGYFKLSGGNAGTYIGTAAGVRVSTVFGGYADSNLSEMLMPATIVYLDSPATTSATTYGVDVRINNTGAVSINRTSIDNNDSFQNRGASSITVMEVTP
jgi:hypothetical protein